MKATSYFVYADTLDLFSVFSIKSVIFILKTMTSRQIAIRTISYSIIGALQQIHQSMYRQKSHFR